MIELRTRGIFEGEEFAKAYQDLFQLKQDEASKTYIQGPLTYILNNYTLKPAKGGSNKVFASWSDQTYFAHVINGIVIAGRLLESRLTTSSSDDLRAISRLFFASHVMHDVNKLFDERDLKATIDEHWYEIIHVIGPYMAPLGGPEVWSEDVRFLILSTEEGSRDQANLLKTHRSRQELQDVADYSKLADKLGSIRKLDSTEIFHAIKGAIEEIPYYESIKIQHISFTSIAQTMIRLAVGNAITKYLTSQNQLLCKLPDGVVYLDDPLTIKDLEHIIGIAKLGAPTEDYEIDAYLSNSAPSGNSLKFDFAYWINVTPDVIDKYISMYNNKIIMWSGKEWRQNHTNLPHIMTLNGVKVENEGTADNPRFDLTWSEDEDRRLRSRLVCARRIFLQLTEGGDSAHEDKWLEEQDLIDGSENGTLVKTLRAFAHAIITPEDALEENYQTLLGEISNILEEQYSDKIIVEPEELINLIMPSNLFHNIQDVPDKTKACLQCGKEGTYPLKDEHSFGTRATSGTGKKITSLKENQKFKGVMCKLCVIENQMRRSAFPDLKPRPMSKNEPICLQIHMGDYVVPVNVSKVLDSLDKNDISVDSEKKVVIIGRDRYQIDYHAPTFVRRPGNKIEEFYFIKNALTLISSTGFKIRISPLFSSDEIFKPTFVWENAPLWIRTLNMDVLRIDQIEETLKELRLLERIASLGKGRNDLPAVITSITRHPRGLFYVANRFISRDRRGISSDIKRNIEWYMEKNSGVLNTMGMKEVVEAACEMVYDKPKSNNDHTWMITTALEAFERNSKASVEDRVQRAAGRLWDYAKRQNKNSGEMVQKACIDFATRLKDLIQDEFTDGIPSSDARKDLIAQFAIMYNIEKWKG